MIMAVVMNPLLLLPAVVGLIALTQAVGDADLNADEHAALHAISQNVPDVTGSVASGAAVLPGPGNPALLRINAPATAEALADMTVPPALSCLQLQAIDEVELIADMPADGDCN
jgi:hypothetical protein